MVRALVIAFVLFLAVGAPLGATSAEGDVACPAITSVAVLSTGDASTPPPAITTTSAPPPRYAVIPPQPGVQVRLDRPPQA